MENRLGDFLAGIEVTFGRLVQTAEERAAFLQAAEQFYLDLLVASSSVPPHQRHDGHAMSSSTSLPFWRYLLYYTTMAVDQVASVTTSNAEAMEQYTELAQELSSCWPLLAILASGHYAKPAVHQDLAASSSSLEPSTSSTGPNVTAGSSSTVPEDHLHESSTISIKLDASVQTEDSHYRQHHR